MQIADTVIWCDAQRKQQLCFISHAEIPLTWRDGAHAKVVTTHQTIRLAEAVQASIPTEVLLTPLGRPFALGRLRLELLASGMAPGAAQLWVELPQRRVIYAAGGINPRGGRTVAAAQLRSCDAIALDPLTASHMQALPKVAEVEAALIDAVRVAQAAERAILILTRPLGPAGELASLFSSQAIFVRAHRKISAYLAAYPTPLPLPLPRGAPPPGAVVLWPVGLPLPGWFSRANMRLFVVGPEAAMAAYLDKHNPDAAFPLAMQADLEELATFAVQSGAREVYLTSALQPQASVRVQAAFAERGLRVYELNRPSQMVLL